MKSSNLRKYPLADMSVVLQKLVSAQPDAVQVTIGQVRLARVNVYTAQRPLPGAREYMTLKHTSGEAASQD